MTDITSLLRPLALKFVPYSTARDENSGAREIYLDANEHPIESGFNRYPDISQTKLKSCISKIKGIPAEQLFLSNGSDEAIDMLYRITCNPGLDNAIMIAPSFGMYENAALMNDVSVRMVDLGSGYSLPVEDMLKAADNKSKLMFVCSPNNPTGNSFAREDIVRLAEGFSGILVVDEAYIDFSSRASVVDLVDKYPNLIVLQTLSKAWAMAGLRIGITIGNPAIIKVLDGFRHPFNISLLSMKAAIEVLNTQTEPNISDLISERQRLSQELKKIDGIIQVYPSDANFLLVKCEYAEDLFARLRESGVIVRDRYNIRGCESCLRITVGLKEENDKCIEIIQDFYRHCKGTASAAQQD